LEIRGDTILNLLSSSSAGALWVRRRGIYLLDEPEAALSPVRQIAFLRLLWQMEQTGNAQFIIATHSPILLAYLGATIYTLDYPLIPAIPLNLLISKSATSG